VSDQKKKEPFDELLKSVFNVIEIDQMELDRVRKERDEWKDRYFMQAERLDRVQTTLRGVENETEEANKAITWLLGYAVVNLVFVAGVIIRIAFYGGSQ
jgi:uncharacterized coiled-coil DUF342 family protein